MGYNYLHLQKWEHNTFSHDNSSNSGTVLEGNEQDLVDNIYGHISFLLLHGFKYLVMISLYFLKFIVE